MEYKRLAKIFIFELGIGLLLIKKVIYKKLNSI
jgi:hypothetical protein